MNHLRFQREGGLIERNSKGGLSGESELNRDGIIGERELNRGANQIAAFVIDYKYVSTNN